MVWGKITAPKVSSGSQFAGDYLNKLSDLLNGIDIGSVYDQSDQPIIGTPWRFKDDVLSIKSNNGDFAYHILSGALDQDIEIILPPLEDHDTPAFLGHVQNWTKKQTFVRDDSGDIIEVNRDTSSVNSTWNISFQAKDSGGAYVNYARIQARLIDPLNGSEDGALDLLTRQNDVLNTVMRLNDDGSAELGGPNRRVKLIETNLTAQHPYTFPDFDTKLTGNLIEEARRRVFYYSDCFDNAEPLNTETVSGTGAQCQIVANTELGVYGVYELETGSTATGSASLTCEDLETLTFGQGEVTFEFYIKIPTLSTSSERYTCRLGFSDSATSTSPVDGVYFFYDEATSANWQIVTRNNSVGSPSISNVPVTTGWTRLKIVINAAGTSAAFYVNGTQLNVSPITTNIPKTATRQTAPMFTIFKTVGLTTRLLKLDYYALNIELTTPR